MVVASAVVCFLMILDIPRGARKPRHGLGMPKVGFLAYSMQNLARNTIDIFVLMNDGLRVSK